MTLHAFKDGLTILNQDNLNSLLALQPFQLIYEGTQRDAKTGSGVVENSIANYNYCARFTLTNSTTLEGRAASGPGTDLVRSGCSDTGLV